MSEASSFALEEGDFIEKASSYDEAFSGQAVNNALEQAKLKNVANTMFSGRKRTGFS